MITNYYRLSKVVGAKLADDNPNITDLSDINRPTKLSEKYSELYDNEWTDAFEECEDGRSETESIRILYKMLDVRIDSQFFCLILHKSSHIHVISFTDGLTLVDLN